MKGWSDRSGGGSLDRMSAKVGAGAGAGVERVDEGADMIVRDENQLSFLADGSARTCVDASTTGGFGEADGVMLGGGDAWGPITGTVAPKARGRDLYQSPT